MHPVLVDAQTSRSPRLIATREGARRRTHRVRSGCARHATEEEDRSKGRASEERLPGASEVVGPVRLVRAMLFVRTERLSFLNIFATAAPQLFWAP